MAAEDGGRSVLDTQREQLFDALVYAANFEDEEAMFTDRLNNRLGSGLQNTLSRLGFSGTAEMLAVFYRWAESKDRGKGRAELRVRLLLRSKDAVRFADMRALELGPPCACLNHAWAATSFDPKTCDPEVVAELVSQLVAYLLRHNEKAVLEEPIPPPAATAAKGCHDAIPPEPKKKKKLDTRRVVEISQHIQQFVTGLKAADRIGEVILNNPASSSLDALTRYQDDEELGAIGVLSITRLTGFRKPSYMDDYQALDPTETSLCTFPYVPEDVGTLAVLRECGSRPFLNVLGMPNSWEVEGLLWRVGMEPIRAGPSKHIHKGCHTVNADVEALMCDLFVPVAQRFFQAKLGASTAIVEVMMRMGEMQLKAFDRLEVSYDLHRKNLPTEQTRRLQRPVIVDKRTIMVGPGAALAFAELAAAFCGLLVSAIGKVATGNDAEVLTPEQVSVLETDACDILRAVGNAYFSATPSGSNADGIEAELQSRNVLALDENEERWNLRIVRPEVLPEPVPPPAAPVFAQAPLPTTPWMWPKNKKSVEVQLPPGTKFLPMDEDITMAAKTVVPMFEKTINITNVSGPGGEWAFVEQLTRNMRKIGHPGKVKHKNSHKESGASCDVEMVDASGVVVATIEIKSSVARCNDFFHLKKREWELSRVAIPYYLGVIAGFGTDDMQYALVQLS